MDMIISVICEERLSSNPYTDMKIIGEIYVINNKQYTFSKSHNFIWNYLLTSSKTGRFFQNYVSFLEYVSELLYLRIN